jgi:hypothetical protein
MVVAVRAGSPCVQRPPPPVSGKRKAPSSGGGAGAGGGEPGLCRDGGRAEEGAHATLGLGRTATQDVRAGRVRQRPLWRQAPGGGVPHPQQASHPSHTRLRFPTIGSREDQRLAGVGAAGFGAGAVAWAALGAGSASLFDLQPASSSPAASAWLQRRWAMRMRRFPPRSVPQFGRGGTRGRSPTEGRKVKSPGKGRTTRFPVPIAAQSNGLPVTSSRTWAVVDRPASRCMSLHREERAS